MSILGLESYYGRNQGSINTIQAVSTLAFDRRRSEFYKKQLIARQDQVKQAILQGVKDWEEYRHLTGKLHALEQEVQELTDLLKKTELEDE